jgi:hypothetical protein
MHLSMQSLVWQLLQTLAVQPIPAPSAFQPQGSMTACRRRYLQDTNIPTERTFTTVHHGSPRSVIHVHKCSMTPHHPQGLLWLQLPALTSQDLLSLSLVLLLLLLLGLWSRQSRRQ